MEEHQQTIHDAVAARRAKEQQEEQAQAAAQTEQVQQETQRRQAEANTQAQIAEIEPWATALLRELALAEWGTEAVVEWKRSRWVSALLALFSRDSSKPRIYRIYNGERKMGVGCGYGPYYKVYYIVEDATKGVIGFYVEGKITVSARPATREALAQALAQVAQEGPGEPPPPPPYEATYLLQ